KRQPLGFEVMSLVDEHGVVLPARYMAKHGLGLDGAHEGGETVVVVGVLGLGRPWDAVGLQHLVAPGMKRTDLNAIFDAAFLHRIFEPSGDAVREAKNQHRFARRARQVFGAKGQDERLSRSSDATNDSVPFA